MGVASVVRDYIEEMPATLGQDLESQQQKVALCTYLPVLWRSTEAFFAQFDKNQHCILVKFMIPFGCTEIFLAVSQQISICPKYCSTQKANNAPPGGIAGWEPLGGWF